jgi:hypothetical protein
MSKTVYHELLENYYRTNLGLQYMPAHMRAERVEGNHYRNGQLGRIEYYVYRRF